MEYRNLAGTNIQLSAITFGTIAFASPQGRQRGDTAEGKKALHLALDMGVNCIHSSYEYGTRHVVREVLRDRKDAKSIRHIIKVPDPDKELTDGKFKPDYFRQMVEDALREMGVEHIHILQWIIRDGTEYQADVHWQRFESYKDDARAIFEKMRDEGKVSVLGNFVYVNDYAEKAAAAGVLNCLLFYHNMWDTRILPTLEKLPERKMSALVLRPFQGGMLTTKRADWKALPPTDRWISEPWNKGVLAQRDQLFAEAGIKDLGDLTRMAVKFSLTSPAVATVITGMNTTEQVKEVLSAVDGSYLDAELARRLCDAAKKIGIKRRG